MDTTEDNYINEEQEIKDEQYDMDTDEETGDQSDVLDIKDDAELIFDKHNEYVFAVASDRVNGEIICTGGEDDKAYVWSRSTGEVLFTCEGHKDSVTCIRFNADSSLLATGDMSGFIQIWKIADKSLFTEFEVNDLMWMDFHPQAKHILLAGTENGSVWMWNLDTHNFKILRGHGSSCLSGVILRCGTKIACGYEDGSVKLWDLKTTDHIHTLNGIHTEGVICIARHPSQDLVASGSSDGIIRIFNVNNGKIIATFSCNDRKSEDKNSVESISFSNTLNLLAISSLDGTLNLWDPSTQIIRHTCRHESGIVKVQWSEKFSFLYTCTLNGRIHQWDARDGALVQTWMGHQGGILDFHVSEVGKYIVSASEDKTSRIFSLIEINR